MKKMVLFVAVLFIGCLNDLGLPTSVLVKKDGSQIIIDNGSTSPIYYSVFERESLALINWAPICSQNNQVQPGGAQAIPITEESFRPSNQAVVYWWKTCNKGEELESAIITVR